MDTQTSSLATPTRMHPPLHPVGGSTLSGNDGGPEKSFQGSFGWCAGRGLPGSLLGDAVLAGHPPHRGREEAIRRAGRADAVQEGPRNHLH